MKNCTCFIACLFFACFSIAQKGILPADAAKHYGETITVYGKVFDGRYLEKSRSRPTFLNIGGAFPNQLVTVMIADSNRHTFNYKPEEYFIHKTVWVKGKVTEANGKPQIVIAAPGDITIDTTVVHNSPANILRVDTGQSVVDLANEIIFTKVEQPPAFAGGSAAWAKYLEQNLRAEAPARSNTQTSVYKVEIQFIVKRNGEVDQVRVLKPVKECPGCVMEALRVIQNSPNWVPAMQNGVKVNYQAIQQITFEVASK